MPLDFVAVPRTHLCRKLLREWQHLWPGYTDRVIFSHLLDRACFKADTSPVIALQPHLFSLHLGIINIHRELARLAERRGFFSCHETLPSVPWNTLTWDLLFASRNLIGLGEPRMVELRSTSCRASHQKISGAGRPKCFTMAGGAASLRLRRRPSRTRRCISIAASHGSLSLSFCHFSAVTPRARTTWHTF